MKKENYTAHEISATLKRLERWTRQTTRHEKGEAIKYYNYLKAENREPVDSIKKRDIKKLGLKGAIIKHYTERVENKHNEILALLANGNIKPLNSFEYSTEWTRSRTWGYIPHSRVWLSSANDTDFLEDSASGCGYDKHSAAVSKCLDNSDIFNKAFYIYALKCWSSKKPSFYGSYTKELYHSLGGTGITSIYHAMEALGLKKRVFDKGGEFWNCGRMER